METGIMAIDTTQFDVAVALGLASDVFEALAPVALTAAGLGIGFYLIQMLLDVLRGNR